MAGNGNASGNTALLILKLLSEKPMYGYEMIEVLRERSMDVFELKVGTLYPLLHSLVKQKLLTSYKEEVAGKLRVYYEITALGRTELQIRETEWRKYVDAINRVLGTGERTEGYIFES